MSFHPDRDTVPLTPTTDPVPPRPPTSDPRPPGTVEHQDCIIGHILRIAGVIGILFVVYLIAEYGETILRSGRLVLNTALVSVVSMAVASLLVAGAGQGLIYLSRIAHSNAVVARLLRKD